jgi:hypothetical protein
VVDAYAVRHGFHNLLPNRHGGTEMGMSRYVQTYRPSRHLARDPQSDSQFPSGKVMRAKSRHDGSFEVRENPNKSLVFDQSAEVTCFACQGAGHYASDCPRINSGAL